MDDTTKKPGDSAVVPPATGDAGLGGSTPPVQTPSDVPGMTPSPAASSDGPVQDGNVTEHPTDSGVTSEAPAPVPGEPETSGSAPAGTNPGLPPLNTPPTAGTTGDGTTQS